MTMVFNSEMLVLAREARGYSQKELAEKLKVSQAKLSQLENSLSAPSDGLLATISEALRFPLKFFSQKNPRRGLGLWNYRKRQSLSKKEHGKLEATANLKLMHIEIFLRSVEIEPVHALPFLDVENSAQKVDEAARYVRQLFNLPRGPIKNMTTLLEDAGVIIVPSDFMTAKMDAQAVRWPGLPPVIFIDKHYPADRLRFTLAHELGHLVMHSQPVFEDEKRQEDEANRFASEFLMPSNDIRDDLSKVTLSHLAKLKPVWKVSMAALLKRSETLGIITSESARYIWMQMGKMGFRKAEPSELDIPFEPPSLLRTIIENHKGHLGYSEEAICEVLNITPNDFKEWYGYRDADTAQNASARKMEKLRIVR